jgi:serine/threonine protein kinase
MYMFMLCWGEGDHFLQSVGCAYISDSYDLCMQYGKVYKALWHGSIVAVKSMVLPGMSGAEKLERMAIMEAAISASLSHPNIVQTFNYSLEPVKASISGSELHMSRSSHSQPEDAKICRRMSQSVENEAATEIASIRSFEIRLVLEFCDCGTVREALDDGAFLLGREVNYLAVLETAADIAKGMIQLHRMNVVHSDLKVWLDCSLKRYCVAWEYSSLAPAIPSGCIQFSFTCGFCYKLLHFATGTQRTIAQQCK